MFWGDSGVFFSRYFGRDLTEVEGVEEFSSAKLKVEYMFSKSRRGVLLGSGGLNVGY